MWFYPDISSINGAFTLISFCSFGFNNMHSLGKIGRDLFKKLKQESNEFITPSSLKKILNSKTKFTFSWISDTRVYISNLCPYMYIITGTMNKALTNCPFLT